MNKIKSNKGITLITLIITIILMTILIGVIIDVSIDGQLFNRAQTSEEKTNEKIAQSQEEISAIVGELEKIEQSKCNHTYLNGVCTKCGYVCNHTYEDSNGDIAIIPEGFTVSGITGETIINDGLVIYDLKGADASAADFWTKASTFEIGEEEYAPEVQTKYNQYVWIPVKEAYITAEEIQYMIASTETEYKSITTNQKAINYLISKGRYPMSVQITDGEGNKTYRGILYNFAKNTDGTVKITSNADFSTLLTESYDYNVDGYKTYYREPGMVSYDYGKDKDGIVQATNYNTIGLTQDKIQAEYNAIVESIAKNGGFYVARYELTQETVGTKLEFGSKRGQTVANASTSSANRWYGLYKECQGIYNKEEDKVQSTMIYGSQWDQIMIFMKDVENSYKNSEEETVNTYYIVDSTDKGVYSDINALKPSGYRETYNIKQIFDLGGNYWEWTAEAHYMVTRVMRGGEYIHAGSNIPASTRYNYGTIGIRSSTTNKDYSARSTLYIKL